MDSNDEDARAAKLEQYGPGPWVDEPDRVEWRYKGLPCLITRAPLGNLCGYVGVPPSHPWHGKDSDDVEADAHGGVTYANACQGHVCHIAQPGEPDDVYWVGFDCAHHLDAVPRLFKVSPGFYEGMPDHDYLPRPVYRDVAYVRAEVEALAEQALEAAR